MLRRQKWACLGEWENLLSWGQKEREAGKGAEELQGRKGNYRVERLTEF